MSTSSWTLSLLLALTLSAMLFISGCVSNASSDNLATHTITSTPVPVETKVTDTPDISEPTKIPTTRVPTIPLSLPYDITISYPSNWEVETLDETSFREYGRTTTNIVNFFSPDITYERSYGIPNPDTSAYTTFSIDVDTQTHSDEDRYFNLATVKIQDYLGSIEITRHEQLPKHEIISGFKTYGLEFISKEKIRHYRFVNVNGRFIVITIKNPLPYSEEVAEMLSSIKITPDDENKKSR